MSGPHLRRPRWHGHIRAVARGAATQWLPHTCRRVPFGRQQDSDVHRQHAQQCVADNQLDVLQFVCMCMCVYACYITDVHEFRFVSGYGVASM
jgi:hypothetical protein